MKFFRTPFIRRSEDKSSDATTLLHFTDIHLYADAARELKGVNTRHSFKAVQELALRHHSKVDLLILGGDLAQDESDEAYRYLAHEVEKMGLPYAYVPGNHDDIGIMRSTLGEMAFSKSFGDWQLIFLNTHVDGEIAGFLVNGQLKALERELESSSAKHVLIVMHHHPVTIDSEWLDEICLLNRDTFWNVVDRFSSVRGVLFGHAHQAFDTMRDQVRLLCTPATAIQFMPQQKEFRLDKKSPGYRWLRLKSDGDIETGVERTIGFVPIDLSDTIGY